LNSFGPILKLENKPNPSNYAHEELLATHNKQTIPAAERYTTVAYGLRQPAEWILASEDRGAGVDVKVA